MQTITLIALGKLNADYYAKAAAEYAKRLSAYCRLNIVELPEEPIAEKNASPAVIGKALEKEARAILAAVPKGSGLAALCVEGKQKTSEELAAYLDERAGSGAGDVAFVIGSSHGLADSVKQTASLRLSMSKMTFPHQLGAGDAAGAALPRVFHQPRRKIPQVTQKRPGARPDGHRTDARGAFLRLPLRALIRRRSRYASASSGAFILPMQNTGRQRPAGRGCIFQRFS